MKIYKKGVTLTFILILLNCVSSIQNEDNYERIDDDFLGGLTLNIIEGNKNAPAHPKILTLGDSISYGYRNKNKGFVGDLGYRYDNIGVSGATLSTKIKDKLNIPTQLLEYHKQTKGKIDDPDLIIANGGVNDYNFGATLGIRPYVAVKTDEEAENLDKDTILGALQFLFYKMIKFYPRSHRFFILGNKISRTKGANSTLIDWTITKNAGGYTQTELYNEFKNICELYGVEYIDIFDNGIINSAFDEYVSKIPYKENNSITYTEYMDNDRIHPLDYGYRKGYTPLIREAIDSYIEERESKGGNIEKSKLMLVLLVIMIIL